MSNPVDDLTQAKLHIRALLDVPCIVGNGHIFRAARDFLSRLHGASQAPECIGASRLGEVTIGQTVEGGENMPSSRAGHLATIIAEVDEQGTAAPYDKRLLIDEIDALRAQVVDLEAQKAGRAVEGGELDALEIERERSRFESENRGDFDFDRNEAGQYSNPETYCVFSGWIARAELTRLRAEQSELRRTVRNEALDEARRAVYGEVLTDGTGDPGDEVYNRAIRDAENAIRTLKDQPAEGQP